MNIADVGSIMDVVLAEEHMAEDPRLAESKRVRFHALQVQPFIKKNHFCGKKTQSSRSVALREIDKLAARIHSINLSQS